MSTKLHRFSTAVLALSCLGCILFHTLATGSPVENLEVPHFMNHLNQERARPQDKPVPLAVLLPEEQDLIRRVVGNLRSPH